MCRLTDRPDTRARGASVRRAAAVGREGIALHRAEAGDLATAVEGGDVQPEAVGVAEVCGRGGVLTPEEHPEPGVNRFRMGKMPGSTGPSGRMA